MRSERLFTVTILAATIGCAPQSQPTSPTAAPSSAAHAAPDPAPATAPAAANTITASIEPRSGSNGHGTVTLSDGKQGVHVTVLVTGIAPGQHGLHFHENGDCTAPDAMSAKGHFNPAHHEHGLPTAPARHLGDLGNIEVGADGQGRLEFNLADASLEPSAPNTLHGKAIILHEKVDDGSQPAGNAGARIGCAVIP